MFLWEWFGALGFKPVEFLTVEMVKLVSDRVSRQKPTNVYASSLGLDKREAGQQHGLEQSD